MVWRKRIMAVTTVIVMSNSYWGLICAECWVSLLMCLPSVSYLTTALCGNNDPHFTEEETESERDIQVVRELAFAHQYIWLLTTTWNSFSRDSLTHWRERTSPVWRQAVTDIRGQGSLWLWGCMMTLLPQEEVRDNFSFPSCPSGSLANHFIEYPPSEGNTFPPLIFAKRHLYWKQASNFALHSECLSY